MFAITLAAVVLPPAGEGPDIHSDSAEPLVRVGSTTPAPCVNDGTDGRRILLVYARTSSDAHEYSSAAPAIRQMAGIVNAAMRTAGGKDVRWHCTSRGTVTVERVLVASHRLAACRSALQDAGHSRRDRLYICFMPTSDDGFNGQAEIIHDADAKVSPSPHDVGPRYASIYSLASSSAGGLMHELGHLLGAVQCSAPHTSCPGGERGHHHCYEEQDLMCLQDGGSYYTQGGEIVDRCPNASTLASRWDCGRDDYFNPDPAPGSYLATHWNTYDSLFLVNAGGEPDPEPSPTTAPSPTGNASPSPTPTSTRKTKLDQRVRTVLRVSGADGRG